jgi:hypothetical protein
VPFVQPYISAGGRPCGGVTGYPLNELYEEIAFVAFHFHWTEGEVMQMEHGERRRWVMEISKLNRRVNSGS